MKQRVLSKARRGEDNAFLKQIQERRAFSVLRIHLINYKWGKTSHTATLLSATDLNLPTQFIFIRIQY